MTSQEEVSGISDTLSDLLAGEARAEHDGLGPYLDQDYLVMHTSHLLFKPNLIWIPEQMGLGGLCGFLWFFSQCGHIEYISLYFLFAIKCINN